MHLTHLVLRNFRNYAQAHLTFSPTVNLILGDNGQGKTNLLEAIYLLSTGRSFRTRSLSDLIRAGEHFFYIEARFQKEGVTQSIKVYYDETTRKVQYNNTIHPHLTALLGILPGVLLSPEDHSLISGSPAERRRFLDLHIAQMDPLYVHHLARYFRALKQRNQLLRTKSDSTLSAWEETMAHSGSYLVMSRKAAISALENPLETWIDLLSDGKDTLAVRYPSAHAETQEEIFTHLLGHWRKTRPKEMHLGSTLSGPHRDDLEITLSGKLAKHFSSEGQKRSVTASLKIAEWQRFKESTGATPLIGIDDFGIQLDPKRLTQFQEQMKTLNQVFLTSPQPLSMNLFDSAAQIIRIENGAVLV